MDFGPAEKAAERYATWLEGLVGDFSSTNIYHIS